jgi:ABC-2 type transport system permease protein
MVILILTTILVSRFVFGNDDVAVWGDNIPGIVVLTLSVVAAGAGLALVIAAFGKNPNQASLFSTMILTIMALIGGAFLPTSDVPVIGQLSRLTLNYWGLEGYTSLSFDKGALVDILPNIGILLLMSAIFFTFALRRFAHRFRD